MGDFKYIKSFKLSLIELYKTCPEITKAFINIMLAYTVLKCFEYKLAINTKLTL